MHSLFLFTINFDQGKRSFIKILRSWHDLSLLRVESLKCTIFSNGYLNLLSEVWIGKWGYSFDKLVLENRPSREELYRLIQIKMLFRPRSRSTYGTFSFKFLWKMSKSIWKVVGDLWSEKQLYRLQKMFKLLLTVTFVFLSKKIDTCAIEEIYILVAFTKPTYLNVNLHSAIIFHRIFPHTTLHFQIIFLFFCKCVHKCGKQGLYSVEARNNIITSSECKGLISTTSVIKIRFITRAVYTMHSR